MITVVRKPVGDDGHAWVQEYHQRNEHAVRHPGRRVCAKCGREPLQVMDIGSRFRRCTG